MCIFIIIIHIIHSINSHHDPCEEGIRRFCYPLFPASVSPTVREAGAPWFTLRGYRENTEDEVCKVAS